MAKDGINRGVRRVRAGDKSLPLADKITNGKAAKFPRWFLGGLDGFLYTLIAFVVIDYLTGIMCGIADKTLSSEVGCG